MGKPSNGAASGRHHGPRALGVTWVLYSGGHPPGFPISPLYRFAKLQDESQCGKKSLVSTLTGGVWATVLLFNKIQRTAWEVELGPRKLAG